MFFRVTNWVPSVCLIACLILGFLGTGGCGPQEATIESVTQTSNALEKTHQSHDQGLQDELRRLSADRALPQQIDGQRITGTPNPECFAATVGSLLDDTQVERILTRLQEFFPSDQRAVSALTLEKATGFLKFYAKPQQAARAALDGPQDDFQWLAQDGWFADTSFAPRAQAHCALEMIAGMDAVSRGDLPAAIDALSFSGRIIRLLATDQHLVSRLTAVDLRNQWLQLVAIAVSHPQLERTHLENIYELMLRQMSQWPDEAKPWMVDRAIGLQTYELIRQGHYLSLLSAEEAKALEDDGMHIIKSRSVQRFVDQDQSFYLEQMRRLIDVMRLPFFQRRPILERLAADMVSAPEREPYPQIAVEILLPNIETAMQRLADDRARSEAWTLALASALGQTPPNYQKNPASGDAYEVRQDPRVVEVLGLSNTQFPRPILVPKL